MKVLKFLTILNLNVWKDDINCVIESRSLSLEYISFQKLRKVYEEFLKSFPTTLKEDLELLKSLTEETKVKESTQ